MKPTPFRPPLRAALAALALACAASSTAGSGQRPAPVAAASAPAPSVAAPPAARPLAPFVGDLASADVAGLKADCAAFLARAHGHIEALKRTARPTPRTAVDAALDRYDEALASLDTASSVSNVVFNSNPDAAVRDARGDAAQLDGHADDDALVLGDAGEIDVEQVLEIGRAHV